MIKAPLYIITGRLVCNPFVTNDADDHDRAVTNVEFIFLSSKLLITCKRYLEI